ncbi:MAG: universal stress protein [Bacteroidota bacterium]|nr:universal stress protein [Bacteroidota bacterium]
MGNRLLSSDTKIHVVSAFDISPIVLSIPTQFWGLGNFYEDSRHVAQNTAEKGTKDTSKYLHDKNSTSTITMAAIEGSQKVVILDQPKTFGADLILVSSHGHGAVASFLAGSFSQAITLDAKYSVEIVRNE